MLPMWVLCATALPSFTNGMDSPTFPFGQTVEAIPPSAIEMERAQADACVERGAALPVVTPTTPAKPTNSAARARRRPQDRRLLTLGSLLLLRVRHLTI